MEFLGDLAKWFVENWNGSSGYLQRTWEHLQVSGAALIAAAVIAVPLGAWFGHTGRGGFAVVSLVNVGRALPSFGIVALCGAAYLWLEDERLDMAAQAAAEGGVIFTAAVLITGPLWARVAWGTWWTWEPRLTLTLLLFFVYIGYFMVRASTINPHQGKRFSAVVGILGALLIPFIHLSVTWFRSLHPAPVVMRPDGPNLEPEMLITFMTGLLSFTLLFLGVFLFRYTVEALSYQNALRRRAHSGEPAAEGVVS